MAVYELTQDIVHGLFDYHKDGYLTWKKRPNSKVAIGDIVGTLNKRTGHIYAGIANKMISIHRIIFLWHHGYLPENDIDHINKNKQDNRIENLREVSRQCNSRNCLLSSNNISGITGVSYNKQRKKFAVSITINYKQYSLGLIDNFDEAVCLRFAIEQCINWNYCDSNSSAGIYVRQNIQGTE